MLIDDWGYNDVGFRSTYMNWTTPTIDKIKDNGVLLTNYYTYEICSPSRASLLTGRYTLRHGVTTQGNELPLTELTIAQELKSAGYHTYMVGKWHVGFSTYQHLPTNRGFDYFYGYVSGQEDYYTKKDWEYYSKSMYGEYYFDLRENLDLVTNSNEMSNSTHSAYVYQSKVEDIIKSHKSEYANEPMFLYYAMQLIHEPYEAPDVYLNRCQFPSDLSDSSHASDLQNYCGMNIMVDEAIANLTCVLNENDLLNNTILVIAGSSTSS